MRQGRYPDEKLISLTVGKTYQALVEDGYVRVWDDSGEDYLYPLDRFEFLQ
jgi:hypothetical protein